MRKEGGERNITPHDKKARKEKKKQDRMGKLWKEDNVILFSLHKSYNLFWYLRLKDFQNFSWGYLPKDISVYIVYAILHQSVKVCF